MRRFLFRLDGSKDNDNFFGCRRQHESTVAYSGMTMVVGPGWIPDLLEVELSDDGTPPILTLVELEATPSFALAQCRKYIPEPSVDIVQRFATYLDGVIAQCSASADPRIAPIRELRQILGTREPWIVRTAGALRSSSEFLEVHTLLDQPERISLSHVVAANAGPARSGLALAGIQMLGREDTDGLRRAARILHEVVTAQDHSGATLKGWRNIRRKPLDIAVASEPERFRQLSQLLAKSTARGMRIDCDRLGEEVATLWSSSATYRLSSEAALDCIRRFVPVVMQFSTRESMRTVYESARSALEAHAAQPGAAPDGRRAGRG